MSEVHVVLEVEYAPPDPLPIISVYVDGLPIVDAQKGEVEIITRNPGSMSIKYGGKKHDNS